MYYVYFRGIFYASATDVKRAVMQDAIAAGFHAGRAFDVHTESGAVVWAWEQRA